MVLRRESWHGWLAVALVFLFTMSFATQANAAILSSKRGFADTGAGYSNLQATGAGWYYTWDSAMIAIVRIGMRPRV